MNLQDEFKNKLIEKADPITVDRALAAAIKFKLQELNMQFRMDGDNLHLETMNDCLVSKNKLGQLILFIQDNEVDVLLIHPGIELELTNLFKRMIRGAWEDLK